MLGQLQKSEFEARVGDPFSMEIGATSVELTLSEVTGHGSIGAADQSRESFSLMFRGPPDVPLTQGIYSLGHQAFEHLELFLVPVNANEEASYWEAVFT